MSQETGQANATRTAVGQDGEGVNKMTTQTIKASAGARLLPAVLAAFIGLALITISGHVQATTLHDAAHDVRHATGFPCH